MHTHTHTQLMLIQRLTLMFVLKKSQSKIVNHITSCCIKCYILVKDLKKKDLFPFFPLNSEEKSQNS